MKFSTDFLKTTAKDLLSGAKILLVLLCLLLTALVISIIVDINDKVTQSENTIAVSATSEVYAAPDLVLASFSVVTEADTVNEALAENTAKMNAVIAFVKGEGVADKDVKTTGFSIYPRYEWDDNGRNRTLVGYEIYQTLQVKIRDLDQVGNIVQGAADEGANQISNLQFTIENEDELKNQAREQAIDEAKEKAKTLASQLGMSLGEVVGFNESGAVPLWKSYAVPEAAMGGVGGGGDIQFESGENMITVSVTITYEIY